MSAEEADEGTRLALAARSALAEAETERRKEWAASSAERNRLRAEIRELQERNHNVAGMVAGPVTAWITTATREAAWGAVVTLQRMPLQPHCSVGQRIHGLSSHEPCGVTKIAPHHMRNGSRWDLHGGSALVSPKS